MFSIALTNVLITLAYIVPGYVLCKIKKASANHLSTLSAVLIYIGSPCMIISSFMSLNYSANNLKDMGIYFIVSFVFQIIFISIIYMALKSKYEDAKYRVMTIGFVLGNVGFFGLPIINAIFPKYPIVKCYSSVNVISMNIIVFTMGVFCVTGDKKYMSFKSAIFNPSMLGVVIGFPLFLFNAKERFIPEITQAITLVGHMTTPLCMIILGIRLATVPIKDLFLRPFVYVVCLGKLLIFPLFCFLLINWLPFLSHTIKATIVILAGTPCASIILNLAEIHQGEAKISANCILLSTMLCFLTIPLLTLLV